MDELLDQPITESSMDVLGFAEVASALIAAIDAQPNGTSLTLGLDGAWGSGKSSILALMKGALSSAPSHDFIGTVIVPFSPWLVTNRTALVTTFFSQLSDALDQAEKRIPRDWFFRRRATAKAIGKAREGLNKFSRLVSIASTAASAIDPSLAAAAIAGGSNAAVKLTAEPEGKTIEVLKRELTDLLAKIAAADSSFRVLVLIDDLDRLDPNDALEVLRLVKAVGNFPATTYLLAYDRSAIARAIEHSAKVENGDAYLEKIIQFSFKVPPQEPFQLRTWLKAELTERYPDAADWTSEEAAAVLDVWAGRLLKTPRDVKRILFAIRAIWPRIEGRANLVDLIWLQILTQKAAEKGRDLYSWVASYLQGLDAVAIGGMVTGAHHERDSLVKILNALGWHEYDHERDKFGVEFHHLNLLLAGITTDHLDKADDEWTHQAKQAELQQFRDDKRLSSPWHWRLYFALETPSHAVTDDEWSVLLQAAERSTEDLAVSLGKLLELREGRHRDTADQILGRAQHLASLARLKHPGRWLAAMVSQSAALTKHSASGGLGGFWTIFEFNLKGFAKTALSIQEDPEREQIIHLVFYSLANILPASRLMRHQLSLLKKSDYERAENSFLSAEELRDISAKQIEFYESLTPAAWRMLEDPFDILYAWKDATGSNEAPGKFLEMAMVSDDDFLNTLSALRCVTSSAQNRVAHVPEAFIAQFIDAESVKERLEKLAHEGTETERAAGLLRLWWQQEH